jgi:hypothetical protein
MRGIIIMTVSVVLLLACAAWWHARVALRPVAVATFRTYRNYQSEAEWVAFNSPDPAGRIVPVPAGVAVLGRESISFPGYTNARCAVFTVSNLTTGRIELSPEVALLPAHSLSGPASFLVGGAKTLAPGETVDVILPMPLGFSTPSTPWTAFFYVKVGPVGLRRILMEGGAWLRRQPATNKVLRVTVAEVKG